MSRKPKCALLEPPRKHFTAKSRQGRWNRIIGHLRKSKTLDKAKHLTKMDHEVCWFRTFSCEVSWRWACGTLRHNTRNTDNDIDPTYIALPFSGIRAVLGSSEKQETCQRNQTVILMFGLSESLDSSLRDQNKASTMAIRYVIIMLRGICLLDATSGFYCGFGWQFPLDENAMIAARP